MSAKPKLSDEQRREIADRFVAGETQESLAAAFSVVTGTIAKVCQVLKAQRKAPRPATAGDITEFGKRARSVLWRQDPADHKTYHSWEARVAELASKDGGGLTDNEAIVRASKEFPCLSRLFREYDVRAFDPNPESHPRIRHYGEFLKKDAEVECEGIDQSYRESLRWAIDAAGENSRTGLVPASCPCNQAWYLYEVAISDPREFLSKVGQIESKGDAADADKQNARATGTRSIAAIDAMLSELEYEEKEDE